MTQNRNGCPKCSAVSHAWVQQVFSGRLPPTGTKPTIRLSIHQSLLLSIHPSINPATSLPVYLPSHLADVMHSVLTTGPNVRGLKPGRGDGFLRVIKISSTTSFWGKVNISVPCLKFFWHVHWSCRSGETHIWERRPPMRGPIVHSPNDMWACDDARWGKPDSSTNAL
jgi:hypothetical protein